MKINKKTKKEIIGFIDGLIKAAIICAILPAIVILSCNLGDLVFKYIFEYKCVEIYYGK